MRNLKIGLLVTLCVITVFLCGILAYGIMGHNIYRGFFGRNTMESYRSYSDLNLILEKEIALEGIENISVLYHMNSNDIFLHESEGDTLTVKEYSNAKPRDDQISTVTVKGDSLEIKGKKRNQTGFFWFFGSRDTRGYTEIWLPASYGGSLELSTASGDIDSDVDLSLTKNLTAASSSGEIILPSVTADYANLESSSGNIRIENMYVTARETCISTSSGDVTVQNLDGNASVDTSSGNVTILDGNGNRKISTSSGDTRLYGDTTTWDICTSSGEVQLEAKQGWGTIAATSGDMRLELEMLTGLLSLQSSSGDVNVELSKDNAFRFEADTSSGDIGTFFDNDLNFSKKGNHADGTYGENPGETEILIQTSSGDVRILESK
ncbi:MAG: DUF4097 domain-containing protein [Roseburia sp.]|nr:DUF4097 domain-containing protein [Roseburia sp.]